MTETKLVAGVAITILVVVLGFYFIPIRFDISTCDIVNNPGVCSQIASINSASFNLDLTGITQEEANLVQSAIITGKTSLPGSGAGGILICATHLENGVTISNVCDKNYPWEGTWRTIWYGEENKIIDFDITSIIKNYFGKIVTLRLTNGGSEGSPSLVVSELKLVTNPIINIRTIPDIQIMGFSYPTKVNSGESFAIRTTIKNTLPDTLLASVRIGDSLATVLQYNYNQERTISHVDIITQNKTYVIKAIKFTSCQNDPVYGYINCQGETTTDTETFTIEVIQPLPSPSPSPTQTSTPSPTPTPSPTETPSPSPSPSPTPTPEPEPGLPIPMEVILVGIVLLGGITGFVILKRR